MARTPIAVHNLAGDQGDANGVITFTVGDATNDHDWVLKDGDILFAQNSAGGAETLTLITTPDSLGRTQTIAVSHGAAEARCYGPLKRVGFAQTDGKCHVDVAVNTWAFAVIRNVGN